MTSPATSDARIETIRTKLATLTCGELYGFSAVKIEGTVREVRIMIENTHITIAVDRGFEFLPAGMTFRAIADHALAAANGSPAHVGETISHREYGQAAAA